MQGEEDRSTEWKLCEREEKNKGLKKIQKCKEKSIERKMSGRNIIDQKTNKVKIVEGIMKMEKMGIRENKLKTKSKENIM